MHFFYLMLLKVVEMAGVLLFLNFVLNLNLELGAHLDV
jgi:hypothetical protein